MDKGFVILAQNTEFINYVECAEVLAASIKRIMPDASIALISDSTSESTNFDYNISLPHGDLDPDGTWKLINDWQVYDASPYEYTIKLEADMFINSNISHWWDVLQYKDIVVCSTIRNMQNEISTVRAYRKFIDDNKLPDVYNAITYFKKSPKAEQFFSIVRDVFTNWTAYKAILQCSHREEISTDWAYSLACSIMGEEETTMPTFTEMSMVHMKQYINQLYTSDWTTELVYELLPETIRLNTHPQMYPLHYHVKTFASKLKDVYGI